MTNPPPPLLLDRDGPASVLTIKSHAALRAAALASGDFAEGVRAFLERRPPRFG